MKNPYLIITVDGTSAVGKGTLSKAIAAKYQLKYLDSGTIYRAAALKLKNSGVQITEQYKATAEHLALLDHSSGWYDFYCISEKHQTYATIVDGKDVSNQLSSEEIAQLASIVSSDPQIRKHMDIFQQAFLSLLEHSPFKGVLLDGRTSGIDIFPEADIKFFITCSNEVKAKRRHLQTGEPEADILASLIKRDAREKLRKAGQVRPADDAIIVDSTNLTIEEVQRLAFNAINNR